MARHRDSNGDSAVSADESALPSSAEQSGRSSRDGADAFATTGDAVGGDGLHGWESPASARSSGSDEPAPPGAPGDGDIGEVRAYSVYDGTSEVYGDWVKLAFTTSERDGATRWSELTIWRSAEGEQKYVAWRVGVSCVVHLIDCVDIAGKNLPSVVEVSDDDFSVEDREPCPTCRPDVMQQFRDDPASLRAEVNRPWVGVCKTAEALVEALYTTNGGVKSLSSLASATLNRAARLDPDIARATHQRIRV